MPVTRYSECPAHGPYEGEAGDPEVECPTCAADYWAGREVEEAHEREQETVTEAVAIAERLTASSTNHTHYAVWAHTRDGFADGYAASRYRYQTPRFDIANGVEGGPSPVTNFYAADPLTALASASGQSVDALRALVGAGVAS